MYEKEIKTIEDVIRIKKMEDIMDKVRKGKKGVYLWEDELYNDWEVKWNDDKKIEINEIKFGWLGNKKTRYLKRYSKVFDTRKDCNAELKKIKNNLIEEFEIYDQFQSLSETDLKLMLKNFKLQNDILKIEAVQEEMKNYWEKKKNKKTRKTKKEKEDEGKETIGGWWLTADDHLRVICWDDNFIRYVETAPVHEIGKKSKSIDYKKFTNEEELRNYLENIKKDLTQEFNRGFLVFGI